MLGGFVVGFVLTAGWAVRAVWAVLRRLDAVDFLGLPSWLRRWAR